ncbi:MAG: hypothetical protein F6K11_24240 [Leptolyngbya sp. SIO3F4]|nr:hypothetical protein [Leptolyngbya sp. SIO3F4]
MFVTNLVVILDYQTQTEPTGLFVASVTPSIAYSYTDAARYPDYLDICHQLMESLNTLSAKSMPLEQLEQILAQHLLHHYSGAITDISIRFE